MADHGTVSIFDIEELYSSELTNYTFSPMALGSVLVFDLDELISPALGTYSIGGTTPCPPVQGPPTTGQIWPRSFEKFAPLPPTAPTVVSFATSIGTTTVVATVPSGAIEGDWLFTFLASQSAVITAEYTIPSGWARVAWPFVVSEGQKRFNAVYAHKVTATAEPASYTWSNAVIGRQVVFCIAVRGANATDPITAYTAPTSETDASLPKIPTVAVPADLSLVIGFSHTTNAAGIDGTPNFGAPWTAIATVSQPTPIAGAANDAAWLGQLNSGIATVGGQIGTVASGIPAADASAIIVIGR